MKAHYLISTSSNPFYNLALEEWCLRNLDTTKQPYLLLYVNQDAVIVGRNQNIFEEVNIPYCRLHKIDICRRVSGGGTVFHDEGNLNWTFITPFNLKDVNNYQVFATPIMALLKTFKLNAYLTERNAIEVAGVKLSGQAQFTNRKNILSHGTLLVHSDLKRLQPSIERNNSTKIESKAAKSVRSQTVNLSTLLGDPIAIDEIIDLLIERIGAESFHLTEAQQEEVLALQKEVYSQDSWIYGKSPKSIIEFEYQTEDSNEMLHLTVVKGKLTEILNDKKESIDNHPLLGSYLSELI